MPDPDTIAGAETLTAKTSDICRDTLFEKWRDKFLIKFSYSEKAVDALSEWAYDQLAKDPEKLAKVMGAQSFEDWLEKQG